MYLICFLLPVIAVTTVTCYYNGSSDLLIYHLEEAEDHFNEFIEKFGKNYGTYERIARFRIFKENLEKINTLNFRENFNLYGITQFSDMREEEFLEYAKCFSTEGLNMTDFDVIKLDNLPDATYPAQLDYRDLHMVTEVKNQGNCLDCYIFSAVGNIEGQYAKKYQQLQSLSEQEVLDCMTPQACSAGGFPHIVMQSLVGFGGLVSESSYPYYGSQKQCAVSKNQIVARVAGGSMLQPGEDLLIPALNMYGPISIAIATHGSFANYQGGRVFNNQSCGTQYDHAVLLVGYGHAAEGDYWLLKNSWGANWAEQGYIRIARGVGMCGIGQYAATATVA